MLVYPQNDGRRVRGSAEEAGLVQEVVGAACQAPSVGVEADALFPHPDTRQLLSARAAMAAWVMEVPGPSIGAEPGGAGHRHLALWVPEGDGRAS